MKQKIRIALLCVSTAILILTLIFAHGSARKYSITFDSKGGSECPPLRISGRHGIALPTPERDGYTFEGWFFDDGVWQNQLTSDTYSRKRLKKDVTVYAKWRFTGYIVSFDANGGSEVESVAKDEGGVIDRPPFTEKEGYIFLGWCVDATLTTYYEFGAPVTKSFTLYAKWLAKEDKQHKTITFVTNGGTALAPIQILEGSTAALPSPSKIGHDFMGWYLDPEFTLRYPSNNVVTIDLTLYAKWRHNPDKFLITFDSDGGSHIPPVEVLKSQVITMPIPEKQGYIFEGWYIDEERTQPYNFELGAYASLTLYAKWRAEEPPQPEYYTVRYYSEGQVIRQLTLEPQSEIENYTPHKAGHIFAGWYADSALNEPFDFSLRIDKDTELYAKWAEDTKVYDDDFIYEPSDTQDYYIITDYRGGEKHVTVPQSVNGLPVREIADNVFKNSGILSIDLASVREIGTSAFANCFNLTQIVIGADIQKIGNRAFYDCNALTTVVIEGVPEMGSYIFADCGALKNVILNDNITHIPPHMFRDCDSLVSVALPQNCQSVGESAFADCRTLAQITFGSQLKSVENSAFKNCLSLSSIDFKNVETIKDNAFEGCGIINLVLSDSVKRVGSMSFGRCGRLKTVYIGSGLETLDSFAFLESRQLEAFEVSPLNTAYSNIANNLYDKNGETLIMYAQGQTSARFDIPDGVKTIYSYAFVLASALTEIAIPASVEQILPLAFMGIENLESVWAHADNPHFKDEDGVLYSKDLTRLVLYPANRQGESYDMPHTVTDMDMAAFMGAKYLKEIALSDNLNEIPAYAFFGCAALESIQISLNVKRLGDYAFSESGITQIVIPAQVTELGEGVFKACFALKDVRVGTGVTRLEKDEFDDCGQLESILFHGSPQYIGYSFTGCANLQKVEIRGDSVTQIAQGAFGSFPVLIAPQELALEYGQLYGDMFSEIKEGI